MATSKKAPEKVADKAPEQETEQVADATPDTGKPEPVKPESNPVHQPVKTGTSKTINGAQRRDN